MQTPNQSSRKADVRLSEANETFLGFLLLPTLRNQCVVMDNILQSRKRLFTLQGQCVYTSTEDNIYSFTD